MPEAKSEARQPQVLMTGIGLGESTRWHAGRLWFADWMRGGIIALDEGGRSEVMHRVAGMPICFDWQPDGRLLVVSGREGRLLRSQADGSLAAFADLTAVLAKPWNDIVVDGRGRAYVDSIGFEFPGGQFVPGIVALVTPDGNVRQVADGLAFPNGLAITPDQRRLIAAESYGHKLTAFDIAADGSLSNRCTWADLGDDAPDGICLDAEGAVWYADVPHQHCVRVAEGGRVLETVKLDRGAFACMLGGGDGRSLFIAAAEWGGEPPTRSLPTGQVVMVPVTSPHAGRP